MAYPSQPSTVQSLKLMDKKKVHPTLYWACDYLCMLIFCPIYHEIFAISDLPPSFGPEEYNKRGSINSKYSFTTMIIYDENLRKSI